jgi:hypothetical protein
MDAGYTILFFGWVLFCRTPIFEATPRHSQEDGTPGRDRVLDIYPGSMLTKTILIQEG